jgi:hypothetical protein
MCHRQTCCKPLPSQAPAHARDRALADDMLQTAQALHRSELWPARRLRAYSALMHSTHIASAPMANRR